MFENYEKYLENINNRLDGFFENQKPYIFCKKGCAKCCKNAQFPYSEIEFQYLMSNFLKLSDDLKKEIGKNIFKIKKEKEVFEGEKFLYDCPFLINDECAVYNFRGIICRTFGLITSAKENENAKVPFCTFQGLNYSNVFDEKKQKLSYEKYKNLGIKQEPLGFNISYDFLTSEKFEKAFNLKFGGKKCLIDWFKIK